MGETCQLFLGQMAVASEKVLWRVPPTTPPKINMEPGNDGFQVSNRNLLFQRSIFRFHVCFQGCILYIRLPNGCCPVSFWGQSCVFLGDECREQFGEHSILDFLRGESHFLQRTPEDKHVILPQDLYYGLKNPKLTLWHPGQGDSFSERHRKGKIF